MTDEIVMTQIEDEGEITDELTTTVGDVEKTAEGAGRIVEGAERSTHQEVTNLPLWHAASLRIHPKAKRPTLHSQYRRKKGKKASEY